MNIKHVWANLGQKHLKFEGKKTELKLKTEL